MVGWEKSIGIPGLVRLELGFGVGLVLGGDGDVEEGFGVVSGCQNVPYIKGVLIFS